MVSISGIFQTLLFNHFITQFHWYQPSWLFKTSRNINGRQINVMHWTFSSQLNTIFVWFQRFSKYFACPFSPTKHSEWAVYNGGAEIKLCSFQQVFTWNLMSANLNYSDISSGFSQACSKTPKPSTMRIYANTDHFVARVWKWILTLVVFSDWLVFKPNVLFYIQHIEMGDFQS